MTKEEIRNEIKGYLKENLRISIDSKRYTSWQMVSSVHVEVSLFLEGKLLDRHTSSVTVK